MTETTAPINTLPAPHHSASTKPTTPSEEAALAKEFEAVFLSQFVDEMMKTVDTSGINGDGHSAEMWRSFMSRALADSLTEQGGFGLAASIEQALTAYQR